MQIFIKLFIGMMLSTSVFSLEYGSYICTTDDKKDSYLINYKQKNLRFLNMDNNVEATFDFLGLTNSFNQYGSLWHTVSISTINNDFIFDVHKANYNANYTGTCKEQEENTSPVTNLIELFKNTNKIEIAKLIDYPLRRKYPIEAIKNKNEFLYRYNEIFDKELVESIIESNKLKDWEKVGSRGTMFKNGTIWLNSNGKIISINYQSKIEKIIAEHIISLQKSILHKSISDFDKPVFVWKTKKFIIRVDDMGENNYRYASWSKDKSFSEKPDIILQSGKLIYDGSAGNYLILFKNGNYTYQCNVNVLGDLKSDYGSLEVYKDKKLILQDKVLSTKDF